MLLNRQHVPWFWFTLLASVAAGVLYVGVVHPALLPFLHLPDYLTQPNRQHRTFGHSPLGLGYGILSYAIFLLAVLLNTRKKFPLARLGRVQSWLRAHIWLTILTLPLVFLHAAFRFGSLLTSSLMWLYLLVMFSGFYGLALQQFVPRMMKQHLTLETIYEQIPYLSQQLLAAAMKIRVELRPAPAPVAVAAAAGAAAPAKASSAVAVEPATESPGTRDLLTALERDVIPYLATSTPRHSALHQSLYAQEFFRALRLRVEPANQGRVDLLASWCEERRQMDLQTRYHHWLHGWLLVHIPASFLLLVVTGWHVVVALFLY